MNSISMQQSTYLCMDVPLRHLLVSMVHHCKPHDTYHNLDRWYYVHIHIEFHFYDHPLFLYICLHDHCSDNYKRKRYPS